MKQIAYITDIHLDEDFPRSKGVDTRRNWERILKDVQGRGIENIVIGGDIGTPESHAWFFESLKSVHLHLSLGNHDSWSNVKQQYTNRYVKEQEECHYSFEEGSFKYLFLDSSSDKISESQLAWLEDELSVEKKILLFVHHPVLAVNTVVDSLYPLKNREAVKSVLLNRGDDIVFFCGHYHLEDDQTEGRIRQIITPASSYQVLKESKALETDRSSFGYRILRVEGEKSETELVLFYR
jgi:Icc protein